MCLFRTFLLALLYVHTIYFQSVPSQIRPPPPSKRRPPLTPHAKKAIFPKKKPVKDDWNEEEGFVEDVEEEELEEDEDDDPENEAFTMRQEELHQRAMRADLKKSRIQGRKPSTPNVTEKTVAKIVRPFITPKLTVNILFISFSFSTIY